MYLNRLKNSLLTLYNARAFLACERRPISGCRLSSPKNTSGDKRQPEIGLRSQASAFQMITSPSLSCNWILLSNGYVRLLYN